MNVDTLSRAVLVVAVLALAGCATPGAEALTLTQTKSPAQLLRNEAVARIAEAADTSAGETSDSSEACEPEQNDPEGLERRWRSTTLLDVSAVDRDGAVVIDEIATTFVEDGWKASNRDETEMRVRVLTNATSTAEVHLGALRDYEPEDGIAQIEVIAFGPCVITEGADSAEVTKLEGRD